MSSGKNSPEQQRHVQISGGSDNQTINELEADRLNLKAPIVTPVQIQSIASPVSTTLSPLSLFKEEASLPGDSDPSTPTSSSAAELPIYTYIPPQGRFTCEFRVKLYLLPDEVRQPRNERVS